MTVVDADTHVIECEETWDYLEGDDRRFRPVAVTPIRDPEPKRKFWLLDGRFYRWINGDESIHPDIREMRDLDGRLREMDRLQIDVQVLYPTFMLAQPSDRTEIQVALCRSYNRWLADVCGKGKGRFRWVVLPPLASMDDALKEVRFGKDHGACGIFMRGIEGPRMIHDSYFFPLYQLAGELDLPICFHSGNGNMSVRNMMFGDGLTIPGDSFYAATWPVLAAFNGLITSAIPDRFPAVRWAFVETGAQWVPYVVREAERRHTSTDTVGGVEDESTALRDKRFYVACRTDDDLPYIMKWAGRSNLVIGTDFGHHDTASEILALQNLRERGTIPAEAVDMMVDANARTLYGLS